VRPAGPYRCVCTLASTSFAALEVGYPRKLRNGHFRRLADKPAKWIRRKGASAFRAGPVVLASCARRCRRRCLWHLYDRLHQGKRPSRVLFVFPDAKHEEQFLGSGSGYRADCAGGHSHIYCALEELLTSITGRPSLARRFSKEAA